MPVGTVVLDHETREPLADLIHHGDRWLAAEAGEGGRGNARFLSNRRRAPSFAEQGELGEERWLRLELKLLADVALVGFPNVGKSTLISRLSAAKPKIADYPFTTLEPNLGVVRTDDGFEMVVADIPGLIEGASEGKGLGHQFLRHVERARALLVLLDLAPYDGVTPEEQERVLLAELGHYRPDLLERPRLVVGSRVDMVADRDALDGFEGPTISSITGEGIPELVGALVRMVGAAREDEPVHRGDHHPSPRLERDPARPATTTVRGRCSAGRRAGRWRCAISPTIRRSTTPSTVSSSSASTRRWRGRG